MNKDAEQHEEHEGQLRLAVSKIVKVTYALKIDRKIMKDGEKKGGNLLA